jgi:hypothetical protein
MVTVRQLDEEKWLVMSWDRTQPLGMLVSVDIFSLLPAYFG